MLLAVYIVNFGRFINRLSESRLVVVYYFKAGKKLYALRNWERVEERTIGRRVESSEGWKGTGGHTYTLKPYLSHRFLSPHIQLSLVFTRQSLGVDSPSTLLPVSPFLQLGPSGRRGTLSSPWHLPPLGLSENLLHSQVKWKGPLHPCGKQHTLHCLTEKTD